MKLRIKSDGVRFRLGPSEARSLAAGRRIVETTAFGFSQSENLTYSVRSADVAEPTLTFLDHHIAVQLPTELVRHWAESDDVAIESQQPTANGTLTLLVEKDFACMHGEEQDIDVFPNPRESGSIS